MEQLPQHLIETFILPSIKIIDIENLKKILCFKDLEPIIDRNNNNFNYYISYNIHFDKNVKIFDKFIKFLKRLVLSYLKVVSNLGRLYSSTEK